MDNATISRGRPDSRARKGDGTLHAQKKFIGKLRRGAQELHPLTAFQFVNVSSHVRAVAVQHWDIIALLGDDYD